jgi:hypothetical protein
METAGWSFQAMSYTLFTAAYTWQQLRVLRLVRNRQRCTPSIGTFNFARLPPEIHHTIEQYLCQALRSKTVVSGLRAAAVYFGDTTYENTDEFYYDLQNYAEDYGYYNEVDSTLPHGSKVNVDFVAIRKAFLWSEEYEEGVDRYRQELFSDIDMSKHTKRASKWNWLYLDLDAETTRRLDAKDCESMGQCLQPLKVRRELNMSADSYAQ